MSSQKLLTVPDWKRKPNLGFQFVCSQKQPQKNRTPSTLGVLVQSVQPFEIMCFAWWNCRASSCEPSNETLTLSNVWHACKVQVETLTQQIPFIPGLVCSIKWNFVKQENGYHTHMARPKFQLLQNLTHKGTWESASKPQKLFTNTLECGKTIQGLFICSRQGQSNLVVDNQNMQNRSLKTLNSQRHTITKSALLSLKTSAYPFATPFSWTKVWWGTSTLETLSWQSHINWNISLLWWTDYRGYSTSDFEMLRERGATQRDQLQRQIICTEHPQP